MLFRPNPRNGRDDVLQCVSLCVRTEMRVPRQHRQRFVAGDLLHEKRVHSRLLSPRRKNVPQIVNPGELWAADRNRDLTEFRLEALFGNLADSTGRTRSRL